MSGLPRLPAHKPQVMDLSHLLNFTLPPRQSRPAQSLPRRSRKTANTHGVWNKERFVNAQYRFVMIPTGDYTVHFADPDIYFQWQDIVQVVVPRSSALAHAAATGEGSTQGEGLATCPICLSPPVAPRMTKCGHVYCFPCMLQYLNMSDNKWAQCPICHDSINEKYLKCVKWYDATTAHDEEEATSSAAGNESVVTAPKAGSILRMRLIQRPQITTLALPRSTTWPSDLMPPHQAPFHFLPDVFTFSKFMLATPSYLIADLTKDLDDLASERRVLAGFKDTLAISFVDGADQKIRHEIAKVAALDSRQLQEQIEKAIRDQYELEERIGYRQRRQEPVEEVADQVPTEFLALKAQGIGTNSRSPAATPPPSGIRNAPKHRRNLNPPPPSTNTYFYYQAASGLPIFLHPLEIKILLSRFGSYSSFPDSISVRVEACSEGTVNDDLRKRCKYLGHLPEGADVVFVEADVSDVVGAEGMRNFENALKTRSARRKEKERKEDKAKARAEEREREKHRVHGPLTPNATALAVPILPSDVPVEDVSEHFPSAISQPPPVIQVAGAWGTRSFASALHTPATQPRPSSAARREDDDEYWDEIAWHELERSINTGGRKKRGAKLVLGSASSGRRR